MRATSSRACRGDMTLLAQSSASARTPAEEGDGADVAHPSDRVLDVATGTGMVAAELVRRYGCSVVGLDQSEEMLNAARASSPRRPDLANTSSS